jgi:hypothetical protein
MAWLFGVLVAVVIAIDLVGPVFVLALLRRRTGRWSVALIGTLVVAPAVAFLLTAGLGWLGSYVQVVVRGNTALPDRLGQSVPQFLWWEFGMSGTYGGVFACTGFGFTLPILGVWRAVHPASFRRAFRPRPDRPESPAATDYGDVAAEPRSAPDTSRDSR